MWDGQYSCNEYGHFNDGFYSCAVEKFRSTMVNETSFQCSVYWYQKYLPENMRECDYKNDFDEIIRIGYDNKFV